MQRILKEEMLRALKSRGMVTAITIGCLIAAVHIIQYQIPAYKANLFMDFERYPILYPFTVSNTWLAGNTTNLESFIYFLILPILAALPFGTSYLTDSQGGFLTGIYMRISRKQYLRAKYIAAFMSGGIAVIIPLLLNLLCCMLLLPNMLPQQVMPYNGICATNTFYKIYFLYPIAYIIIFLCIDFLLGGFFSCVALSCSFLSDYKVIVAISPFFLQLAIHVICTMLGMLDYSSVFFAQSGYGLKHLWVLAIYFILGILLMFVIFEHKGEKEDVF